MIISNVEALRTWLMEALQPICDADPSTLAKYVLALVKKDKPMGELKDLCIDQLAVFLGEETVPFVGTLFEALESQSYEQTAQPLMSQKSEDVIPDDDRDFRRRNKRNTSDDEQPEVKQEPHRNRRPPPLRPQRNDFQRRRHNMHPSNNENRIIERRREPPHDNEAARASEERRGLSDGEQAAEARNNDNQNDKPTRSLSPPHRRSPSRHLSPNRRHRYKTSVKGDRDHRRSRREDERRGSRHKGGPRSREEEMNLLHELARESMNGGANLGFNPLHGLPPSFPLPPAPLDHRSHFQGIVPPSVGGHIPLQPPLMGSRSLTSGVTIVPGQPRPIPTPYEINPRFPFFPMPQRPMHPGMMWNPPPPRGKFVPGGVEPYNPEFPSIETLKADQGASWPTHHPRDGNREQALVELTPAPTTTSSDKGSEVPKSGEGTMTSSEERSEKKHAPVTSEKSAPPPVDMQRRPFQNQTILELRKIPQQFNDILSLGQYFQRFGKVLNIKVRFDGDPQAALVEFASNSEARLAYSCPEAVLGNRFIKMFWHSSKPKDSQKSTGGANAKKTFPKEMTYVNPEFSAKEKQRNADENHHLQDPSAANAVKNDKDAKLKAIAKRKMEIQKQRHVLLEKNIGEQKRVITLLSAKKQISVQDKEVLLKTLKMLEVKGEKLKIDIEKATKEAQANPLSKQTIQKDILDGELELLNQQYSGLDTSALKQKLDELKKRALSFGVLGSLRGTGRGVPSRGRGRGRGSWQRPKPGTTASSLDNRSRQFFVWGFDQPDKDELIARCGEHGNMERADEKLPGKLLISFETRKQAESAAKDLSSFKGKKLTFVWYEGANVKRSVSAEPDIMDVPPAKLQRRLSTSSDISMISRGGDEDKLLEFDEKDFLLLADEEEEDDEKGRPWKR